MLLTYHITYHNLTYHIKVALIVQDARKTTNVYSRWNCKDASCVNNPLGWFKMFSQQGGYLKLVILFFKQVFLLRFVLNRADCAGV